MKGRREDKEKRRAEDLMNTLGSSSTLSLPSSSNSSTQGALERGREKMSRKAMFYDRNRDGSSLEAFRGRPLNQSQFGELMKRGLGLDMSRVEISAVFNELDEDGGREVDGSEFYNYYFQLGYDRRVGERRDNLSKLAAMKEEEKERERVEREELRKWEESQVADYTEEDVASGLDKIGQVAVVFSSEGAMDRISLNAFSGTLTPSQYKKQLERSFGIYLTPAENKAMVEYFDTDRSGTVEGSEVL